MNLYKVTLSLLLLGAAPVSARLRSDEKDSTTAMRELMAKFDALESKVAKVDALESQVASLKSKVASLEKDNKRHRGLEGLDLEDLPGLDIDGIIDPSSGGGLHGILYEIIGTVNKLIGIKNCVAFDTISGNDVCSFGGPDIDEVYMEADDVVQIGSAVTDAVLTGANSFIGFKTATISSLSLSQFSTSQFHQIWSNKGVRVNGGFFPVNPIFPQIGPQPFDPSSMSAANATDVPAKYIAMLESINEPTPDQTWAAPDNN